MVARNSLEHLASRTCEVYSDHGAAYDRQRTRSLMELPWLERFAALLPTRGSVLDVGCGAGEPIARYFIEKGYSLTGVDCAEPLLELAKTRFAGHTWVLADMRTLDMGCRFDGVIAWHSLFHLTQAEQPDVLKRLAKHVQPGGPLLLTAGPEASEAVGHVAGEAVYHASLAPKEYERILRASGMKVLEFVARDAQCGDASVLLAHREDP